MALVLLSPPALEPVSLAELKEFCRVDLDDTSQDNVIATLGMAARSWCEVWTQRRFVQQTWRLLMDFFPGYIDLKLAGQKVSSPFVSGSNAVLVGIRYAIMLPYPPVWSIADFIYQNANGEATAMNSGTDYAQDLQSNPARLTPPFGAMWPVARVVPNAVQVDFQNGYALPLVINPGADQNQVTAAGYTFGPADVGRPISIVGAGLDGGTLNTVIAGISSPPDSKATLRDDIATGATDAPALLVNNPNANPAHWEMFKGGIKMLTEKWFEKRIPDDANIPRGVKAILSPARDLRF